MSNTPDASRDMGAAEAKTPVDAAAGSRGDAAAVGDAASDGPTTCLGSCLEALYAECPKTMQACVQATTATNIATCYANGVKQNLVQDGTNTVVTVTKANGALCYTITIPSTMSESVADATGAKVDNIEFLQPSTRFTVTCLSSGLMTSVDLTTPQCSAHAAAATPACTVGACAWP